ncbi:MAG: hypothetical protein JXM74_07095 [Fusobacteriaceae bacterium]|nr:hypothetical protein [Fusobacteriaceae bacterium]
MAIKCLYLFKEMTEVSLLTNEIENINWNIEKEYLKERVLYYQKTKIFNQLKKDFLEKKLTIWPLKDEEVITWIDTLSLLSRVLLSLFKQGVQTNKMSVIMEYPIVFGNHMRTDYLLIYDRLIIVLEFGMFNQDEKRSEERYTKKLQESNSYRQILDNLLKPGVDVVNYVMIYRPEYNRFQKSKIHENILYNKQEIEKLVKFIYHLVNIQDTSTPLYQLEYFESLL